MILEFDSFLNTSTPIYTLCYIGLIFFPQFEPPSITRTVRNYEFCDLVVYLRSLTWFDFGLVRYSNSRAILTLPHYPSTKICARSWINLHCSQFDLLFYISCNCSNVLFISNLMVYPPLRLQRGESELKMNS